MATELRTSFGMTGLKNNIMSQTIRGLRIALLTIASIVVANGCAETARPEATGKGSVRGINAIVTSPELLFLIEERSIGSVNYRGVGGFDERDDLDYTYNFDILLPGATDRDRIASQYIDVIADTEHTLALTGTLDNPSILVWEEAERDWTGTETVFEADFIHLSPQLGQVDVHFALEDTIPIAGNEIGTLSNGERLPYVELPEGKYELILTAPGDPATILFQSAAFEKLPAERIAIAFFDPDPSITAPVGVSLIFHNGAVQKLRDINSPAQLRTLHASFGEVNFDGYLDDPPVNVVFPNVAFGEVSAYADVAQSVLPLTLTPVSDPGTELLKVDYPPIADSRSTFMLFGPPGALVSTRLLDDARSLSTYPVVRITHFSSNIDIIDIYEVDPGTVLNDEVIQKFIGALVGISTGYFPAEAGMREFVLTVTGEKDSIAVPVVLDLANGDIVDMVILDTVDPAVVELKVFDSNF